MAISGPFSLKELLRSKTGFTVTPEVPTGVLYPYAGSSAPSGYVLCDGSAISRTTYAELFAVLGTAYGSGDGSTTFNLPDMRGRMPIGAGNDGTSANNATRTRGDKGGDWRLQAHTHSTTVGNDSPDHTHGTGTSQPFATHIPYTVNAAAGSQMPVPNGVVYNTAGASARHTHSVTVNAHSRDQGGAENMPPFLVTNYIIKT